MTDLAWFGPLRRLNLNHLFAFMAVAEMRSFRAAAMLINISQSALSVQVRQLEQDVGVPLLHRTTRAVQLTEEGKRLYAVSKRISNELAQITTELKGEAALQRGTVSVTALSSLAATLLPRIMSEFAQIHPSIDLKLHDSDSRRARDLLRQGIADVGVLSRNEHVSDMRFVSLFEDDFVAVVPAIGHALSNAKKVTIKDLAEHPLLLGPKKSDMRDILDQMFRDHGLTPQPTQEIVTGPPMIALVSFGFGVCVLPRMSLLGLDLSRCRLLPIVPARAREIGLVAPRDRSEAPAIVAFREFVVGNAKRFYREALDMLPFN